MAKKAQPEKLEKKKRERNHIPQYALFLTQLRNFI